MLKLREVLKMTAEQVAKSEEAKHILQKNWDILNEDIRASFKEFAPAEGADDEDEDGDEGAKGIDAEALKGLIDQSTRDHISKKADAIAKTLVDDLQEKIVIARKQAIDNGGQPSATKNKENDEKTRLFLLALKAKDTKTLKELGMKAIDTTDDGSGADAGYTIPEPLANEVIRLESVGYGRARELFAYHLLNQGNTRRITALGSTLSVFWLDEGEKKPSSQPSFSIVTLALKKLAVIVPMTEEVVEDTGIDLTGLVAQLIREAIDQEVDLQFFNGDGTVWTGVFQGGNGETTIPVTKLGDNEDVDDLRPEDILKLADETSPAVNGKYHMHRTVLSKVRTLRQNDDGTGDYLYNPLGGGDFGTINGRPVELIEAAPTKASAEGTTTPNLPIMLYGDLKRGAAYGEKSDIRLKMLDQATITDTDGETVINLAEQDMIAMRAVQRVGYKVTLPSALRLLVTGD
jgi:HK97 family phage major capsid protein